MLGIISNQVDLNENINQTIEKSKDNNVMVYPKISLGTEYYQENYFYIINEVFSNLNDWTEDNSGGGDAYRSGNQLRMEGAGVALPTEVVIMTYSPSISRFIHGEIQFDYSITIAGITHTLYFEVRPDGGSGWTNIWQTSSGSGTANIDLDTEGYSNEVDFQLRFRFRGTRQGDFALIDNVQLGSY